MPESSLRNLIFSKMKEIDNPLVKVFDDLTTHEKKVAVLTMCGWNGAEIANDFGVTGQAISYHRNNIIKKAQQSISQEI